MVTSALIDAPSAPPLVTTGRYWTARRLRCFELLCQGKSGVEVARILNRVPGWVYETTAHPAFKARVAEHNAALLESVKDYGYGAQGRRLQSYDATARELDTMLAEGYRTKVTRYDREGNVTEEREVFEKDLVSEKRAVLHAIAEELGQLPRAGDSSSGNLVLIREVNVHIER